MAMQDRMPVQRELFCDLLKSGIGTKEEQMHDKSQILEKIPVELQTNQCIYSRGFRETKILQGQPSSQDQLARMEMQQILSIHKAVILSCQKLAGPPPLCSMFTIFDVQ
ncbi:unnamed protein product [Sphagnum tenellum]